MYAFLQVSTVSRVAKAAGAACTSSRSVGKNLKEESSSLAILLASSLYGEFSPNESIGIRKFLISVTLVLVAALEAASMECTAPSRVTRSLMLTGSSSSL